VNKQDIWYNTLPSGSSCQDPRINVLSEDFCQEYDR
jgi:hypothetical protein